MKRRKSFVPLLLLSLLLLCACGKSGITEKPSLFESPESKITSLSGTMTEAEIAELDKYENLQILDLSGSRCYDAIESYIRSHPQVKVIWSVLFDGQELDPQSKTVELSAGNYSEFISLGKYFPELAEISLGETDMSIEEIHELHEAFPSASISYTVSLFGKAVDPGTGELDLSDKSADELLSAVRSLRLLPALERIELVAPDGSCRLNFDEFAALADELPEVGFDYNFELFGQTVSTSAEELRYDKVPIGNKGVPELRRVLPYMKNLRYLLLDCCGIRDYSLLGQLNEDFPDTEVVWRVHMGEYDCLTDAEMIWLNANVNDELAEPLKYCTKCRYIDMGHCDITNIDFCAYMPELEVAIFALSRLQSIEPLRNCPKLEYLEIYATEVSDVSPLENCHELQHLNMGSLYTITDISPLYGLTSLKRLRSVSSGVPVEQQEEIMALLPDCDCQFGYEESSGGNWRRGPAGQWVERYALLREQFGYDDHKGVSRTFKYDLYVD